MYARLLILLFTFKVIGGSSLIDKAKYWDTSFAEELEGFLNNSNHTISLECMTHLLLFAQNLKLEKEWAMEMYDAGAKLPPPGTLAGNLVDLGNFDECLNIRHSENNMEVYGKYCIGSTIVNSKKFHTVLSPLYSWNALHAVSTTNGTISIYLARCFPDKCSTTEMQRIYTAIDFELIFSADLCQTKATQQRIHITAYIVICFLVFICCLLIFSTIADVVSIYQCKERPHQMVTAFSIYENGKNILQMSKDSSNISCVHGIRVLSCMWIILFHRHVLQSLKFPITNFFYYRDWFQYRINMIIHSAPLAVDTFFLLSGLLVAYNYLITTSKGIKFRIGFHYIQRYLRVTPVLAVMILGCVTLAEYLGSGPLFVNAMRELVLECHISWWRALLHIQNINMDQKPMCLGHSWYLSTDMQLYILSPLLIIPLKKWPKQTFFVIGFFSCCSMFAGFFIGWFYKVNAIVMANKNMSDFLSNYYFPMYTRVTPWFVGLILGYTLVTFKEKGVPIFKHTNTVCILWVISFILLGACVFIGHVLIEEQPDRLISSLQMALVRPIWAVATSWIIFACANGYGGTMNYFLSLPAFQILSKLTFSMYLVHPFIIVFPMSEMREPHLLSGTLEMFQNFWGDFVSSLIVALLLSISIELPILAIYKYFVQKYKIHTK